MEIHIFWTRISCKLRSPVFASVYVLDEQFWANGSVLCATLRILRSVDVSVVAFDFFHLLSSVFRRKWSSCVSGPMRMCAYAQQERSFKAIRCYYSWSHGGRRTQMQKKNQQRFSVESCQCSRIEWNFDLLFVVQEFIHTNCVCVCIVDVLHALSINAGVFVCTRGNISAQKFNASSIFAWWFLFGTEEDKKSTLMCQWPMNGKCCLSFLVQFQ